MTVDGASTPLPGGPGGPEHLRLARNTGLSLVAIGLLGGSRLAYNVVVGRRFGAATLGQASIAINTAMFASLLVSGGFQAACAKYLSQAIGRGEPGQAAAIYRRTLAINTVLGVFVAAGAAIVLRFVPGAEHGTRSLVLAAAIALAYNGYQHAKGSSYGFGRVGGYLVNEAVSDVVLLGALAAVAIAGSREWVLPPMVAGYGFFSIFSLVQLRPDAATRERLDETLWREIRGFAVLAVIGTVASAGFLNISVTFAGRYSTPAALGHFSAALALVIPVYFFPRALSLALFPSVAYRFGEQRMDSVRRQLEESTRTLAVLLLPAVGAGALLSRYVLRILYGDSYGAGAGVLAILLAATYLSVIPIPSVTSLSGTERRWYKVPVLSSVAGLILGVILWLILGPRYGAIGIAWGYLIGSIPQAVIPMVFAGKVFGVRFGWLGIRAAAAWGGVLTIDRLWHRGSAWAALAATLVFLIVYAVLFGADLRRGWSDLRTRLRRRADERAAQ